MNRNQSRPGFELVLSCPIPTTITITPRAPPNMVLPTHDKHAYLRIHKIDLNYLWLAAEVPV